MHPAFSVVFFTTASGAGFGLLALTGILFALRAIPLERSFGATALGLAMALAAAGLLSSAAHLGRPERAWRAMSQWRTSWLSREGVASLLALALAGAFGLGWVIFGRVDALVVAAGILAALGALATTVTTGMIYASLKPIQQWHSPYTLPGYILYAAMTGALLLNAILHVFGAGASPIAAVAPLLVIAGWAWKSATWRHDDRTSLPATVNSATGLAGGAVRSIEWPHTEENYLLKEMGYRIARKHAVKLRKLVHLFAFALPLGLSLLALVLQGPAATLAALAAALVQAPGILIERWLFFAEARHTIVLYYGR